MQREQDIRHDLRCNSCQKIHPASCFKCFIPNHQNMGRLQRPFYSHVQITNMWAPNVLIISKTQVPHTHSFYYIFHEVFNAMLSIFRKQQNCHNSLHLKKKKKNHSWSLNGNMPVVIRKSGYKACKTLRYRYTLKETSFCNDYSTLFVQDKNVYLKTVGILVSCSWPVFKPFHTTL